MIHKALAIVGVTPARVKHVLGADCKCDERRQSLNLWARRILAGRLDNAIEYLDRLLS